MNEHVISIRFVKSRCGDEGHYDEVAECSCGEMERVVNSHRSDRSRIPGAITAHRLSVIEKALAIRVEIRHAGYGDD